MTEKFQARIEKRHADKLRKIEGDTGLTKSQILRILLEIAEVQPTVFTLNLAKIEGQPQQELQHA